MYLSSLPYCVYIRLPETWSPVPGHTGLMLRSLLGLGSTVVPEILQAQAYRDPGLL